MVASGSSGFGLQILAVLLLVAANHPSRAVEFCEAQLQLNTQCQDSGAGGYFAFRVGQSDVSECWSDCALGVGCVGFNWVHAGQPGSGGPGFASTDGSGACYYIANTAGPMTCVDGVDCYLYAYEMSAGASYKSSARCCELGEGPSGEGAVRTKPKDVPLDIMAKIAVKECMADPSACPLRALEIAGISVPVVFAAAIMYYFIRLRPRSTTGD